MQTVLALFFVLSVWDIVKSELVSEICYSNETEYIGTVNVTATGLPCQRWDSNTPNRHDEFRGGPFIENYCRPSSGFPRPWCYNSVDKQPRWEYCDIPYCINPIVTCPSEVPNGALHPSCLRIPNDRCEYTCDNNFDKTTYGDLLCQPNKQWDRNLTTLCRVKPIVTCPSEVPNGALYPSCLRIPNDRCEYTCDNNFDKTTYDDLLCQLNKQWDRNLTTLCRERKPVTCRTRIPNGFANGYCEGKLDDVCTFFCYEGYKLKYNYLTCNRSKEWTKNKIPVDEICIESIYHSDDTLSSTEVTLVAVLVSVACLALLVAAICYCKRRTSCCLKSTGRQPQSGSISMDVHESTAMRDEGQDENLHTPRPFMYNSDVRPQPSAPYIHIQTNEPITPPPPSYEEAVKYIIDQN